MEVVAFSKKIANFDSTFALCHLIMHKPLLLKNVVTLNTKQRKLCVLFETTDLVHFTPPFDPNAYNETYLGLQRPI